jgi:dolichol-phosphate mannosyltransferase
VDDRSTDSTLPKLLELKKSVPQLRVLQHRRNMGQSTAVVSGVYAAKYPLIATLDGDGQNNPADIIKLYATIRDSSQPVEALLIAGCRQKRQDNIIRLISSRLANQFRQKLLKDACPDSGCGLKLFARSAFLRIPHFNHVHRFLPALFMRAGATIINVPVSHRPRTRGTSKYGVMNRLWVGIVDIIGTAWLIRRPCRMELTDEL